MSLDNMFGTGMSLGQFGFMDEMEGSGREAAIQQVCETLKSIHRDNPHVSFENVIDDVLESAGLDPFKVYDNERKLIDACEW